MGLSAHPHARQQRRNNSRSSQTLDRGLSALEVLAGESAGLTVTELAGRLGVHRTNVYRLLTTLTQHRLVRRASDGRYILGTGVIDLVRGVAHDLRTVALPILTDLAERAQATAYVTLADEDEAIALVVVEPRRTQMHVAYRVGFRHPLDRGASGLAILAGRARGQVSEKRSRQPVAKATLSRAASCNREP